MLVICWIWDTKDQDLLGLTGEKANLKLVNILTVHGAMLSGDISSKEQLSEICCTPYLIIIPYY